MPREDMLGVRPIEPTCDVCLFSGGERRMGDLCLPIDLDAEPALETALANMFSLSNADIFYNDALIHFSKCR